MALQQDGTKHDMICETDNERAKYIHYKQMITPPSNRFLGKDRNPLTREISPLVGL